MKSTSWFLLALLTIVAVQRFKGGGGGPALNREAPPISAPLASGERFELSEHQGQVVLLDFWATWCPPCRASLPALSAVRAHYQGQKDVWIGTVNKERLPAKRLTAFLTQLNAELPIVRDTRGFINAHYQVSALPTMVLIGRDGRVKRTQVGLPYSDPQALKRHLIKMIDQERE
jgi:thiol-disulfide isomerase/thioredoxin